jgi:uncharacterized protein (TIGR00266 family)
MACSPNVKTDTKFQGAKSLFSGEGAFFLRAFSQSGSGQVFYNAYGAIKEIDVTPDNPVEVDNGHLIAFTEGVSYRVATESGLLTKNFLFGGEGLILQFSGAGKLWIQSRNLWALAASAPFLAR